MGIFLIVFALLLFANSNHAVAAESISVSKTITVEAKVLPAQYIILDKHNRIIEIGSNSSVAVVPTVFREKIAKQSELPLTGDISTRYKQLILEGQVKPGIMYKKTYPVKLPSLRYSLALQ